jgi:hypothetical protein
MQLPNLQGMVLAAILPPIMTGFFHFCPLIAAANKHSTPNQIQSLVLDDDVTLFGEHC